MPISISNIGGLYDKDSISNRALGNEMHRFALNQHWNR